MEFLIIAIDHGWQLVAHRREIDQLAAERARFETLLTETIANGAVDQICEESDPCRLSIAQKMAYEHNPRILWENIDMSAQERLEAGIWEALLNRPAHAIEETPGYYRTIDHRIPEDDIREHFFVNKIIQEAGATGAKRILILCGDMHADFVKSILETSGHQVEINRNLIPRKYWQ